MATKNKIIEMIASIKTIYPYYAKGTDVEMLVKTWVALLKDYPDNAVETAFFKCLQTCKTPPTPADVIEKLDAMPEIQQLKHMALAGKYNLMLEGQQHERTDATVLSMQAHPTEKGGVQE